MKPIGIAPRRAGVVLAVLAMSGAIAACGSSSSASTTKTTASGARTSTTRGRFNSAALRTCLKRHGVTLPTRRRTGVTGGGAPGGGAPGGGAPGAGGPPAGGFFGGGGGAGSRFSNPKFRAAIQACGGGNFRGGRAGGFRARISHTAINNFVACVRKHGYPQMPNPNFSGKGGVFPSKIRTNPKFVSASKTCAKDLIPPRPATGQTGQTGPGA